MLFVISGPACLAAFQTHLGLILVSPELVLSLQDLFVRCLGRLPRYSKHRMVSMSPHESSIDSRFCWTISRYPDTRRLSSCQDHQVSFSELRTTRRRPCSPCFWLRFQVSSPRSRALPSIQGVLLARSSASLSRSLKHRSHVHRTFPSRFGLSILRLRFDFQHFRSGSHFHEHILTFSSRLVLSAIRSCSRRISIVCTRFLQP